ncbi:FAD-linked oxidase C-terminal domain-containing protein [Amnibacterium soli]|uniref:FAD-linked oxidase C-terminal domain-containing protein n=1 Tax=Amnibacterium soli TaxID=1282736 RepID=A0ABP8YWG2_9MICO
MEFIDELRDAVGPALRVEPAEIDRVRTDRSGWTTPEVPLAVVRARSTEDVQAVLRLASAAGVPVVPRGAGTGLAGGAVGSAGSVVLDVSGMDRVLEVDEQDETAVVQPGVITDDLAAVLAPRGLWWPPDPASRAISTVGGNIATNAGGLLCAKYGVTRESVLGLQVVLADGALVRLGRRTVKGVTGYDLTALLIGSEGTLGVVVEATLKLRRTSADPVVTIGATFPDVRAAAAAAAAITASGLRCAALEILDAASCAAIDALVAAGEGPAGDLPTLAGRGAFLLVQTDGGASEREAASVLALIADVGGEGSVAQDPVTAAGLVALRRAAHPAYARLGEVLIEDVCVPRTALPAMFDAIDAISLRHGLPIPTVAHAGDGNLHPNIVIPASVPHAPGEIPDVVWAAGEELFRTAIALGGTLTGEHGVGVLKRRWIAEELGDDVMALSTRVKAAFDPLGILNPGKVF